MFPGLAGLGEHLYTLFKTLPLLAQGAAEAEASAAKSFALPAGGSVRGGSGKGPGGRLGVGAGTKACVAPKRLRSAKEKAKRLWAAEERAGKGLWRSSRRSTSGCGQP